MKGAVGIGVHPGGGAQDGERAFLAGKSRGIVKQGVVTMGIGHKRAALTQHLRADREKRRVDKWVFGKQPAGDQSKEEDRRSNYMSSVEHKYIQLIPASSKIVSKGPPSTKGSAKAPTAGGTGSPFAMFHNTV